MGLNYTPNKVSRICVLNRLREVNEFDASGGAGGGERVGVGGAFSVDGSLDDENGDGEVGIEIH